MSSLKPRSKIKWKYIFRSLWQKLSANISLDYICLRSHSDKTALMMKPLHVSDSVKVFMNL